MDGYKPKPKKTNSTGFCRILGYFQEIFSRGQIPFKIMTTEDKNLLVADFMQLERHGLTEYLHNKTIYNLSNMKYNSSWDWLMPVIDELLNEDLELYNTSLMGDITHALVDIDIKKTFEAVARLIQYINNQEKN